MLAMTGLLLVAICAQMACAVKLLAWGTANFSENSFEEATMRELEILKSLENSTQPDPRFTDHKIYHCGNAYTALNPDYRPGQNDCGPCHCEDACVRLVVDTSGALPHTKFYLYCTALPPFDKQSECESLNHPTMEPKKYNSHWCPGPAPPPVIYKYELGCGAGENCGLNTCPEGYAPLTDPDECLVDAFYKIKAQPGVLDAIQSYYTLTTPQEAARKLGAGTINKPCKQSGCVLDFPGFSQGGVVSFNTGTGTTGCQDLKAICKRAVWPPTE